MTPLCHVLVFQELLCRVSSCILFHVVLLSMHRTAISYVNSHPYAPRMTLLMVVLQTFKKKLKVNSIYACVGDWNHYLNFHPLSIWEDMPSIPKSILKNP